MRAFARLLDRLSLTQGRNAKLTLVRDFLKETPDPDRGWALAALTGAAQLRRGQAGGHPQGGRGRGWTRCCSAGRYDFVGDLAETVALVWPAKPGANREPELSEVVDALRTAARSEVQGLIEGWLDALDADGRWALLKLLDRRHAGGALGAAGQAGGGGHAAASTWPRSRRSGTCCARPTRTCSPGWRAAPNAPRPTRRAASGR